MLYTDFDSNMNFCEGRGTDFNNSDVDAESGEEDRCQECIRYMRLDSSPSAIAEWVERKIKRKAKRENTSEERARPDFSWDVEGWRHESSSDVDVDSDAGAEEAIEEEGSRTARKRGFEAVNKVSIDNSGSASGPERTALIQEEVTEEELPVKRARIRKAYPKLQENTSVVKKAARQQKELMTQGGRVLRNGKAYRNLVSLEQDVGYDADAGE